METIYLLNGTQKKIADGHPWVYRTQIARSSWETEKRDGPLPGMLVDVCDFRNRYLGTGIYNPQSMITVRILSKRRESIDEALIRRRVREALAYRALYRRPDTDSYRLIFAEADRLPGVIADQFADTIVLQTLALGMEIWQTVIADTLIEELKPANLILQNEEAVRQKENLPLYRKVYYGQDPGRVKIHENGLILQSDLADGQKTGYFLDQKANHAALRQFSQGKTVLDCFSYLGGFALNAAVGGASQVTAVDISESAIALARENAGCNQLADRIDWVVANAFDYLRDAVHRKAKFDVIVLDPPAFAKSHAAQAAAARGYKEINLSAFRLLAPGGILATHSCSFHMPEELFIETVLAAARDAHRIVRILDVRRQDHDHPVLAGYPESHYLKSLWLQVVE
jgi:23S rRNA (cytosine1962-C5)-methyltransferase